jgi:hypothetical protein
LNIPGNKGLPEKTFNPAPQFVEQHTRISDSFGACQQYAQPQHAPAQGVGSYTQIEEKHIVGFYGYGLEYHHGPPAKGLVGYQEDNPYPEFRTEFHLFPYNPRLGFYHILCLITSTACHKKMSYVNPNALA